MLRKEEGVRIRALPSRGRDMDLLSVMSER